MARTLQKYIIFILWVIVQARRLFNPLAAATALIRLLIVERIILKKSLLSASKNNGIVIFVGRLTLIMTVIMCLQEEFSQPTWDGSGTHFWVTTHSLRSPGLHSQKRQVNIRVLRQSHISCPQKRLDRRRHSLRLFQFSGIVWTPIETSELGYLQRGWRGAECRLLFLLF